jgi:D-glycero-D-manno-heptose 1,7-bisphosphate phosphatase
MKNKAIFLDRDGVINRERGDYTWRPEDFSINEGVANAIRLAREAGYMVIVISNQGGIGRGIFTSSDVEYLHDFMTKSLAAKGAPIDEVYYCPHHESTGKCLCRKPGSLMLEKALARFSLDADKCWFVGDSQRDVDAGTRAGIPSIKIIPNSSLEVVLEQITRGQSPV